MRPFPSYLVWHIWGDLDHKVLEISHDKNRKLSIKSLDVEKNEVEKQWVDKVSIHLFLFAILLFDYFSTANHIAFLASVHQESTWASISYPVSSKAIKSSNCNIIRSWREF